MMNVNLADLYQAANIPLTAEDFKLRQEAFEADFVIPLLIGLHVFHVGLET